MNTSPLERNSALRRSAAPWRVVTVHEYYREPGGEDVVFEAESTLLESYGHPVVRHVLRNDEVDRYRAPALAVKTVWNWSAARALETVIRQHRADVVHFHNTFPLLSPAAYRAAREAGAAVVHTLHNYRLVCPSATLFRDGARCTECVGRAPLPAVVHGCYRDSRLASAVTAAMLTVHRGAGTWGKSVDSYVALSRAGKEIFVQGGLPEDKVTIKPNFLEADPGEGSHGGGFALFVGRLSPEKGVATLVKAWQALGESAPPLRIAGAGPLAAAVRGVLPRNANHLGRLEKSEIFLAMKDAAFLVVPSEWPEPFGLVAIEAFATGLPVIASRTGALPEIVRHGSTGLLVDPGDPLALANAVRWACRNPAELARMGRAARAEYRARYTPEANYRMLWRIYEDALRAPRAHAAAPDGC